MRITPPPIASPTSTRVGSTVFHWGNLISPLIPHHFCIFVVSTYTRAYRPIIYHHFLRYHTTLTHPVKVVAHSEFINVMYCHLSSMFLSRGVTRCARLFSLLSLISCMDFQRNATAGAPKGNGGYRRDEDFDPPPPAPTGNITSQQPSAAAQTQSREQTFVPIVVATPACDKDVSHSLSFMYTFF